jgi:hypothetical protein
MTLHIHRVSGSTLADDGDIPLHVPEGWQIADGNGDDIRVCGAYPWKSGGLVFANGDCCRTALLWPKHAGAQFLFISRNIYKNYKS